MKKSYVLLALGCAAALSAAELPGQAVYMKTKCDTCHGKDAKGNQAMARIFKVEPAKMDLTKAAETVKADELKKAVTDGQGKMPAYKAKLKPEEIDQLVAYVQSLAPAKKNP